MVPFSLGGGMVVTKDEAFLEDIRENPSDDAPRLIYADWLEDHGDPARAEFIRVQCELVQAIDSPRRPELRRRERELWQDHGRLWSRPLRTFSRKFEFHRGFADRMVLRARAFLNHGAEILRLTPLTHVKFREARDLIVDLAGCKLLGRIRSISFESNKLGAGRLATLLASPHLTQLEWLTLNNNALGNKGAEVLAASPVLGRLRSLDLTRNHLGAAGVHALVRSPRFAGMRRLILSANGGIL